MEFDSVTTGTGDRGESGTYTGERLPKDDLLFELLGSLDELNSWLGLIKAAVRHGLEVGFQDKYSTDEELEAVQRCLHRISAEAATAPGSELYATLPLMSEAELDRLEQSEQAHMASVPMPNDFILPGGTRLGATIDIARTVCRRAERCFVRWLRAGGREGRTAVEISLRYLNRLSDFLFVLARAYEQ